jgi:hypothetical protein
MRRYWEAKPAMAVRATAPSGSVPNGSASTAANAVHLHPEADLTVAVVEVG